jgi:hypothetical protein
MKKKNKYYAILSKKDKFLYGAFPVSKEGKIKAEEYIKKISVKSNAFYIKKI